MRRGTQMKWSRQEAGDVTVAICLKATVAVGPGTLRTAVCGVSDDSLREAKGAVGLRAHGQDVYDGLQAFCLAALAHTMNGRPGLSFVGAVGAETNSARVRACLLSAGATSPSTGSTGAQFSHGSNTRYASGSALWTACRGALCIRRHVSASTANSVFPAELRRLLSVACGQSSSFHHPVGAIL